jgi:hypothetical protein
MILNIADPSCDVVKILNDFATDLERGAVKSQYKDKKEFDGLILYHWICKDNVSDGFDSLNITFTEFDQAFKCMNDLLTVWLEAGLISRDDLTRHYFVK